MLSLEDIDGYIERIYALNGWVNAIPNSDEFRERTTIREFQEMLDAKRAELGLIPEVDQELRTIKGNAELDRAYLELGMTLDIKELLGPSYFEDFPLNYYDMPEYESAILAVEAFMAKQPKNVGVSCDVLAEVVRDHMLSKKAGG